MWKLKCCLLQLFAFTSLAVLIASIISFCLESHILFRETLQPDTNVSHLTVRQKEILTKPMIFLEAVEYLCVAFFTVEIMIKIVFCPSKRKFFKKMFNWIDICIVIPCYLCTVLLLIDPTYRGSNVFRMFNALRLIRIFRILKLTVHVSGLKILGHTIRASAKELLLLFLVLIIGVLIFACLIYYAEQVEEPDSNSFSNIPLGFWWAVVTMTTLGKLQRKEMNFILFLYSFLFRLFSYTSVQLTIHFPKFGKRAIETYIIKQSDIFLITKIIGQSI